MRIKILGIVGFIGFLLLNVSVNALEQDTISVLQCAIQSFSGLLIIFLSCHFTGIMTYQSCKTNKLKNNDPVKNKTSKKRNKQAF